MTELTAQQRENARQFLINSEIYKPWQYRGNWGHAFRDGYWAQIEGNLEEVSKLWKEECNLDNMVHYGARLATEFLTTVLK